MAGSDLINTCDGEAMLGGYKVFGKGAFVEKAFAIPAAHSVLRLQLKFYKVDRWDWHEYAYVSLDGAIAWSHMFEGKQGQPHADCGTSWKDAMVQVDVEVPHTAATATVRVHTNINDRDEWWGVQDVSVSTVSQALVASPPSPPGTWSLVAADTFPTGLDGWRGRCEKGAAEDCSVALTTAQAYTCGSWGTMIGGYKVFGRDDFARKTFGVSEPHTHLRVQLRFVKIDRWDWHEYGYITIDGAQVWSQMLLSKNSKDGESMCGFGGSTAASADSNWVYNDKYVDVDVTVAHTGSEATLKAFTNLQDSDEFWGVGDVRLTAGTDLPEAFALAIDDAAAAKAAASIDLDHVAGPFADNIGLGTLAIGLLLGSGVIMVLFLRRQWRVLQQLKSSALKKVPVSSTGGSSKDIVAVIVPPGPPMGQIGRAHV